MVTKLDSLKASNKLSYMAAILLYTLLTMILTFPLILHINDWLPLGDPSFNTWVLAWDVHSLTMDPFNLFNTNIFYPFTKNTLAFSEHLFADMLIAFPVISITHNSILAYNLILILSFILSGFGMFLLINYYIKDKYAAFVGGVIFAFCTIRFAHFLHLQLLTVQWMPFTLLYLDKFLHFGKYKDLCLLYIFYVLQVLSSWYLAFYTMIILGAYTICVILLNKEIRQNLSQHSYQLKLILFLICSTVTVAPFAIPYFQVTQEYGFERNLVDIGSFSADVADYFLTMPENLIYGGLSAPFQLSRAYAEHSLFPGISVIILALYGILCFKRFKIDNQRKFGFVYVGGEKRNVYLFTFFLALLLSLGYPLHLFGHIINMDLPYKFLFEFIPGFKSMRVPTRIGIIVMFSLSILASYGLNKVLKSRNHQFIISSIVLLFILTENLFIPITSETMPTGRDIPEVYKWLGNNTEKFAIVEFPTGSVTDNNLWFNTKYLYYSIYHWKYLVNGYSGFFPEAYLEISRRLQTFPSNDSINTLQKIGVKYAILHSKDMTPDAFARIQGNISNYSESIKLIKVFGNDYVYLINETSGFNSLSLALPFSGFYGSEDWNGVPTRWMKSKAILQIYSSHNYTANLGLRAVSFYHPRTIEVYADSGLISRVAIPSAGFLNVTMPIHLVKGTNSLRFQVPDGCERPSDKLELNNPDSRYLSVAIQNITLSGG